MAKPAKRDIPKVDDNAVRTLAYMVEERCLVLRSRGVTNYTEVTADLKETLDHWAMIQLMPKEVLMQMPGVKR